MSRQHHHLKTMPEYFEELKNGNKTFEVRFNDRNYKKGDILYLHEYIQPETFTKRVIRAEITYLLNDENFCKVGYVIMGIKVLKEV